MVKLVVVDVLDVDVVVVVVVVDDTNQGWTFSLKRNMNLPRRKLKATIGMTTTAINNRTRMRSRRICQRYVSLLTKNTDTNSKNHIAINATTDYGESLSADGSCFGSTAILSGDGAPRGGK